MKKKMFKELLSSVQEMGAIMRGEKPAARVTEFSGRGAKTVRRERRPHVARAAKKSAAGH